VAIKGKTRQGAQKKYAQRKVVGRGRMATQECFNNDSKKIGAGKKWQNRPKEKRQLGFDNGENNGA